MSKLSTRFKLSYIIGSVVLVLWFVSANKHHEDPVQTAYEGWLKNTLPKIHNPKLDNRPAPEITLSAEAPERNISWTLTLDNEKNKDKVVRLLEMLREADVLSAEPPRNPAITMKVISNSESFSAGIEAKKLEDNEKAQSLLKLFQIYANQ